MSTASGFPEFPVSGRDLKIIAALIIAIIAIATAVAFSVIYLIGRHDEMTLQAQQKKESLSLMHRLCTSLSDLADNRPPRLLPSSNHYAPLVNPGRLYDVINHNVLSQLSPDIGCIRLQELRR